MKYKYRYEVAEEVLRQNGTNEEIQQRVMKEFRIRDRIGTGHHGIGAVGTSTIIAVDPPGPGKRLKSRQNETPEVVAPQGESTEGANGDPGRSCGPSPSLLLSSLPLWPFPERLSSSGLDVSPRSSL